MKDKLKELMLDEVRMNNGVNIIKASLDIMGRTGITAFTTEEFHEAYDELTSSGEMIELKYTDPASPSTGTKTILFSKGTQFLNLLEISNGQKTTTSQTDLARKSD